MEKMKDEDTVESGPLTPMKTKIPSLNKKALWRQVVMTLICVSGPLIAGAAYSQISVIQMPLMNNVTEPYYLSASEFSWFGAFHTIAAPFGGLVVMFLMDRIGRINTMFMGSICATASHLIMAINVATSNSGLFYQLLFSRFVMGITAGIGTAPCGAFIGEISHPKIRGRLVLFTSLSIATGITSMYVIGYFIRENWRLISWISCGYSICSTAILFLLKESPSWLMSKGKDDKAMESLKYFRGYSANNPILEKQIEYELQSLKDNYQRVKGVKKPSFWMLSKLPEVYKPLLIVTVFFALQQFTGTFVVIVYAVKISEDSGVTIDSILCAIYIGLARLITTAFMSPVIDKLGRRPLVFCSGIGMAICMFALSANIYYPEEMSYIPYLPVIALNGFIVTSTLGFMTLPFTMTAELFPQKVKGMASGIVLSMGVTFCFINLKLYSSMTESWGRENVFLFYGLMALIGVVCMYFIMPETKGKTLLEIEENFKYGKHKKHQNVEAQKEKENLFN